MDNNLQQHLIVVAGVAADRERFFIARRGPNHKASGRWEFPGGKVGPGESFTAALRREIKEELGVDCTIGEPLGVGTFPGGTVIGYRVEFDQRPEKSTDHDELKWVHANELLDYPLAIADYSLAVAAVRHKVEIDRVGVGSVVRFAMGIYFLIGLLVAVSVFLFQSLMRGFMPPGMWDGAPIGLGAVFFVPILYAILGAVMGLILAGLYNLLSMILGGILVEIRRS